MSFGSWIRRRWTTRTGMVGISILAVSMGVLVPAFRVAFENDRHFHVYLAMVEKDKYNRVVPMGGHESSPFWPRYWRCLLGRPWVGRSYCARDPDRLGEVCYLAHPELQNPPVPDDLSRLPALEAEFKRLWVIDPRARPREMQRSPLHRLDHSPLQ